MKNFWKRWTTFTKKIATLLANAVLFVVFCIFVIPLGIILKIFFKKSLLGHDVTMQKNSYWIKRRKTKHDLQFAREQ